MAPFEIHIFVCKRGGTRSHQGAEEVHAFLDGRVTPADLEPIRPMLRQALPSTAVVDAGTQSLAAGGAWTPIGSLDCGGVWMRRRHGPTRRLRANEIAKETDDARDEGGAHRE